MKIRDEVASHWKDFAAQINFGGVIKNTEIDSDGRDDAFDDLMS